MREIELKFRVKDQKAFLDKLQCLGCRIAAPLQQIDTVFVNDLNNVESTKDSIWIRIRQEEGHVELNLKKQSSKIQESQEIEFRVESYEKVTQFLETLGYKKWVIVNKKRRYTTYLNYNLCLDEVEKLGTFIEIELLVDDTDKRDYMDQLMSFARDLGLDESNIINSHYDTMIYELG